MGRIIFSLVPLWLGAVVSTSAYASGPWSVTSPNGKLSLVVEMKESAGPDAGTQDLSCRVLDSQGEVLPSAPLGITLKRHGAFTGGLRFVGQFLAPLHDVSPASLTFLTVGDGVDPQRSARNAVRGRSLSDRLAAK